jgi:hypothetical protein
MILYPKKNKRWLEMCGNVRVALDVELGNG